MQDKELIIKIQQNDDQAAFRELIDNHREMVFRIAIGFLHDKNQADDIVQDVFIKFWEVRKDFELKAKFSTWLYRVTSNHCINVQRKNKFSTAFSSMFSNNGEYEKSDFESQIKDNQTYNDDDNYKKAHLKLALKTAINSLAKKQRIAFVLSKYQDFSYKEIAETMELSISSVESLLFRAKKNLQKKLLNTYKEINN